MTGVQTCALPIYPLAGNRDLKISPRRPSPSRRSRAHAAGLLHLAVEFCYQLAINLPGHQGLPQSPSSLQAVRLASRQDLPPRRQPCYLSSSRAVKICHLVANLMSIKLTSSQDLPPHRQPRCLSSSQAIKICHLCLQARRPRSEERRVGKECRL